ncbi:MAG: tRNA pseudouridine(38-40) synthase TruA [Ignavibacteria bacterium]|nr:tRNA pseudouridine(38-40) synthase TruA [Ignavibacteria bacterium]MBT8383030.1 tRNA pseudouridine(38-40) synthase TruA [Ignavibacteria bacterium]MBT8391854.1 tRNA pseudouridine(38-40) synthase TruA [Ignavibacteria bacterium]NNJ53978.1 tRNA pseudouridine(38-40) synthase TruA [Ignavibacteriaceae bacterium]NNL21487.1 tRNA pseudouridine(38-40) synthase TruA [Ignavibacteriaceae bacterium]
MFNYKMKIKYDGTNYSGWQIQENAQTIQQVLKDSIEQITRREINLIGSGRTDAGVHALGQVANFKFEKKLNLFKFKNSVNSILPTDISVSEISEVNEDFHSRFNAKTRSYLYLISKEKSPFYHRYSYFYKKEVDFEKLKYLTKLFTGKKDFTSFCKVNTKVESKICNVLEANWRKSKIFFLFYIESNRFLYGMVRAIIGTLLRTLEIEDSENYIKEIFESKNRESAADAAPAEGLFLFKVKY